MKNISLLLSIFLFVLTAGPVGRQFQRTDSKTNLEAPEITVSAPPPAAPASQSTPTPPGQADANAAALSYTFVDGPGGNVFTSEDNMIIHSTTDAGVQTANFGEHHVFDTATNQVKQRKFIQRFDLSAIPAGNQCISANVYYYKDEAGRNPANVTVRIYSISQANGNWLEGEQYGGAAAPGDSSWDYRIAPNTRWAGSPGLSTAGVDYEPSQLGSFVIGPNKPQGTEFSASLNCDRVEGWFGPNNTNYGILLVAEAETNAGYVGSAENDQGLYPKLVVEYSGTAATVTPTSPATRTPTRTPTPTRTRDPNQNNFNYVPLSINQ